jgi:hypothetical protein
VGSGVGDDVGAFVGAFVGHAYRTVTEVSLRYCEYCKTATALNVAVLALGGSVNACSIDAFGVALL